MVATHDIQRYSHKEFGAPEGPVRSRKPSSAGRHRDDLAALVIAAGRADTVRDIGSRALGASAQLG
jgi:hypothetical protein